MAKKKNITSDRIIEMYMDYVLQHNEKPKSIYIFAKENNFEESDFYQHYTSFENIETSIFTEFFHNTLKVLAKSEEYETFDARNKLLSFYFTFFEVLTANRSYVVYVLEQEKNVLKKLKKLSNLRTEFLKYITNLEIETLELKQEQLEKIQQNAINESAWRQLIFTLKFWLDDASKGFEKTDLFIEKSVNASFDLMNITPLKSVIDLGKFLFKEKMKETV